MREYAPPLRGLVWYSLQMTTVAPAFVCPGSSSHFSPASALPRPPIFNFQSPLVSLFLAHCTIGRRMRTGRKRPDSELLGQKRETKGGFREKKAEFRGPENLNCRIFFFIYQYLIYIVIYIGILGIPYIGICNKGALIRCIYRAYRKTFPKLPWLPRNLFSMSARTCLIARNLYRRLVGGQYRQWLVTSTTNDIYGLGSTTWTPLTAKVWSRHCTTLHPALR
jgi:hypothetical protein